MGGSPRVNNNQSWPSLDIQVLDLPATAGLALAGGLLLWPSTGMDPSCAATESTLSTAFARRRGPLILKPMLTTDMEAMADTVSATGATAMEVLATGTASGRLTPTPTMAMVAYTEVMVDTVSAMATVVMDTARGLPIPRPTLTMAMGATVLAMEAMAMAV